MLGDSFTEGLWVDSDDTFSSVFTKNIYKNYNTPIKVYNLGVRGYSVLESSYLFEKYENIYKPDIVVINLFLNDVAENYNDVMYNRLIDNSSYDSMFSYLEKINNLCNKNNIRFFISVIPCKEQLIVKNELYFQNKVIQFSNQYNIPCLNPFEYFQDIKIDNLYFSWDPHFSKEGHYHYAKFLEKKNMGQLIDKYSLNK